jgi:hypothetical protein
MASWSILCLFFCIDFSVLECIVGTNVGPCPFAEASHFFLLDLDLSIFRTVPKMMLSSISCEVAWNDTMHW